MFVALIYFRFILVPICMAIFLNFLLGPCFDLFSERPLSCCGCVGNGWDRGFKLGAGAAKTIVATNVTTHGTHHIDVKVRCRMHTRCIVQHCGRSRLSVLARLLSKRRLCQQVARAKERQRYLQMGSVKWTWCAPHRTRGATLRAELAMGDKVIFHPPVLCMENHSQNIQGRTKVTLPPMANPS